LNIFSEGIFVASTSSACNLGGKLKTKERIEEEKGK